MTARRSPRSIISSSRRRRSRRASSYVADLTGATPRPGGKHAGMGTHNALVKLGERLYLEIIAIDPDGDQADAHALVRSRRRQPDGRPPGPAAAHSLGRAHARLEFAAKHARLRSGPDPAVRARRLSLAHHRSRRWQAARSRRAADAHPVGVTASRERAARRGRFARAARGIASRAGPRPPLARTSRPRRRNPCHVRSRVRASPPCCERRGAWSRCSVAARSAALEAFAVSMPRDVPYLGPLGPGDRSTRRAISCAAATARSTRRATCR